MYRYLHHRNHLCSKIKLILSINGHKLNSHRNAKRKFFWGNGSYPPTKVPDILQYKTTSGFGFWPKYCRCARARAYWASNFWDTGAPLPSDGARLTPRNTPLPDVSPLITIKKILSPYVKPFGCRYGSQNFWGTLGPALGMGA